MATVFPFNQLPSIPTKIQEQLAPLIIDQQLKLVDIVMDLKSTILSISVNANCDDAEILKIKNLIESINQILGNIRTIIDIIPTIANVLSTVSSVAQILSSAQLAIPTGPPASISQLISSAAELLEKLDTFISVLETQISSFTPIFNKVSTIIADADRLLINTCGTPSNFVGFAQFNANNVPIFNVSEFTLDRLAELYPSTFYTPDNVTDQDIENRLNFISNLLEQNLDVYSRLNEAPSNILILTQNPSINDGNIGDYAINVTTNTVFGPKEANTGWN